MVKSYLRAHWILFTEVNPDKGTETYPLRNFNLSSGVKFTEVNPDKGTETSL